MTRHNIRKFTSCAGRVRILSYCSRNNPDIPASTAEGTGDKSNWSDAERSAHLFVKHPARLSGSSARSLRIALKKLKNHQCASCGLPPEWRGHPLTLHLDHINGDCGDCRLENLQWLCPNCHAQKSAARGPPQRKRKIHGGGRNRGAGMVKPPPHTRRLRAGE